MALVLCKLHKTVVQKRDYIDRYMGGTVNLFTKICKQAFSGSKKLKTIVIKGKISSVGKNAFNNINNKATIQIKATKANYKKEVKLIKKSSTIPKTVKFKRVK
ncbi:MAG: leucine-rich repeat domain-containing protein [Lachnospiraceae bacterium]|nr:leucine-rich repeat domain-containing protein [Lachnospiraceae bacterium]